jgi:hypothetical protein
VDSGITRKISGFYPDFFRVAPSGASSVFRASVAVVQPFVQPSSAIKHQFRLPHLDSIAALIAASRFDCRAPQFDCGIHTLHSTLCRRPPDANISISFPSR